MCAWLARGLHAAAAARINHHSRCDLHQLLEGLHVLGIPHLYMPLDPYLDSHAAGAFAPDTMAKGKRDDKAPVEALSTDDLLKPVHCDHIGPDQQFLPLEAIDTIAERRQHALRRQSDRALGRTTAAVAARRPQPVRTHFCSSYHANVRADSRYNLTTLDTVQIPTGATRRSRFRW